MPRSSILCALPSSAFFHPLRLSVAFVHNTLPIHCALPFILFHPLFAAHLFTRLHLSLIPCATSLWNNLVKLDYIWSRSEFTHLIIETAVLLVAPIPFLGPQTTVVSLMFARLYLLFHLLRDFSEVYRNRRDIVVRVFDKVSDCRN